MPNVFPLEAARALPRWRHRTPLPCSPTAARFRRPRAPWLSRPRPGLPRWWVSARACGSRCPPGARYEEKVGHASQGNGAQRTDQGRVGDKVHGGAQDGKNRRPNPSEKSVRFRNASGRLVLLPAAALLPGRGAIRGQLAILAGNRRSYAPRQPIPPPCFRWLTSITPCCGLLLLQRRTVRRADR